MKGDRSIDFKDRLHNRYWWHKRPENDYVPLIYSFLENEEWSVLEEWFESSERDYSKVGTGETAVPGVSLLFGLISGNGIHRVVQLGHYIGYSTILLGCLLRKMGHAKGLFSVDIDEKVTNYSEKWVEKAGLGDYCRLVVSDSASPDVCAQAEEYFGGEAPQLVYIDSSHQYRHTLKELDLWYPRVSKGGFIVLHDTSRFASQFDRTGEGGVLRAVTEWCTVNSINSLAINSFVSKGDVENYPYKDGCGLMIIQKVT